MCAGKVIFHYFAPMINLRTNPFLWFFILILGGLSIYSYIRIGQLRDDIVALNKRVRDLNTAPASEDKMKQLIEDSEHEDIQIIHSMHRLLGYHEKLYFAGKAKNNTLMEFYLGEMEEELKLVSLAPLKNDSLNHTKLVNDFGITQIKKFRTGMSTSTFKFEQSFHDLTVSCNSCHAALEKPFIRITTPKSNTYTNLDFSNSK